MTYKCQTPPLHQAAPEARRFWRTLEERCRPANPQLERSDEFPPDAPVWPTALSRRRFLEVMSASLALAGAGCGPKQPREAIEPYVSAPERMIPGVARYYATAMPWQGFARGVLAESHLGRPTKLEGNPDQPDSLGATDAVTQASVLDLYDPDRSRSPRLDGSPAPWQRFENDWLEFRNLPAANTGGAIAILTEPTTSPTLLRCIHRMLDVFPSARWYQHSALPRFDRGGRQTDFDPAEADVIVSIGSDLLFSHPASIRHARAFASRRRLPGTHASMIRLYAMEPTPTVTGSMADHRLPASPARIRRLLAALASAIGSPDADPPATDDLSGDERHFVQTAARDLRDHAGRALVIAGEEMDDHTHRIVADLNKRIGATAGLMIERDAVRSDADPRADGSLADFVAALESGAIRAALVLGSNPVHTAPAGLDVAHALAQATFTLHMGSHVDETTEHCRWHLPESHFLEAWSDLRAFDGTATIVQPLIDPLFGTRTIAEVLDFCISPPGRSDHVLVRETWQRLRGGDPFDYEWNRWLRAGIVPGTAAPVVPRRETPEGPGESAPMEEARTTVLLRADPNVQDGRWANNAWLQEIPRPISHLVWDNAALVSPTFARKHDLATGDVVLLQCGEHAVEAPVWLQPGQASDCVTLHLGYGRPRAGRVGRNVGFNAFRIRSRSSAWQVPLTGLRKTGRRHELVSTQGHFSMEGREIVRIVEGTEDPPHIAKSEHAHPRLFPEWGGSRYAWGMVIDLGTCIGCNACTVACQAENNIPVVGKEQVALGREMHWIRVDRYYVGEPENPRMVHQPVPCMHCETAPCELVCPVHATVHSSEGLNDMVYNRCIGTRYCSNNCPYKVRRFNFLDYQVPVDSLPTLQKNPDVTVRTRGVMEKCTYCVQRINAARIEASRERRDIREGEIQTACQQVCPTGAIVFGDLRTPDSAVAGLRRHPLNYALLPELNTQPRTTYLARVFNPLRHDDGGSSA